MHFRSTIRRDDGFSIAETVIAAAILFFVLTAIIGLVGVSQRMTVAARQKTAVTNAVAEYIDRLRNTDYNNLALEPAGAVKAAEDISYGPYTIHFTNRVVFPDGANGEHLKSVYIHATVTVGTSVYRHNAVVHIKNPKSDTNAATIVDPNGPVITLTSQTPAENSVLYGKWVHPSGTAARIAADVHSPEDKITKVEYHVGGVLVRDNAGVSGDDAQFVFVPGMSSVSTSSRWDTTQEGVRDGIQNVVVAAWDDQGRYATEQRAFIIDNEVPGLPGVPQHKSGNSTRSTLEFNAAADPVPVSGAATTFATRYAYGLYKEPSTTVTSKYAWSLVATGTVPAGPTLVAATLNKGPISAVVNTEPFSRYWMKVNAGSPRDYNPTASEMTAPFISRPEVRSTATNVSQCTTSYTKVGAQKTTDYAVVLWVTKPTFPVSSLSYKYYAKQNIAGSSWLEFFPLPGSRVTEVGNLLKLEYTYRQSGEARNLWLQVGISPTPSGWGGGAAVSHLLTNAAGVTPLDTDGRPATSVTAPLNADTTWAE